MKTDTKLKLIGLSFFLMAFAAISTPALSDPLAKVNLDLDLDGELASPDGAAGMKVVSINGDTVIHYKGAQVWEGKTQGMITTKATNINGKEYAVAMDGDKILWETGEKVDLDKEPGVHPGIVKKWLDEKHMGIDATKLLRGDLKAFELGIEELMDAGESEERTVVPNSIKVITKGGDTEIFYEGNKVWEGRTKGKVTAKATNIDGKKHAVALDDDKIIWETGDGEEEEEPEAEF